VSETATAYYKKDFWSSENLKYSAPHFRLEKAARLLNNIARGRECDLLDLGCGPAALMNLLRSNIRYHGIDIAVQHPGPLFREMDFVEGPIEFGNKRFDLVIAQGVFEYIGGVQEQKFAEIKRLLNDDGKFVVTYVNFDHCRKHIYWPYNNVRSFNGFYSSLSKTFRVERYFPTSHRWQHDEPRRRVMKALQSRVNINIPVLSRLFGVEYFFICSK
jgi:SAM-dependent methyltransferase